MRRVFQSLVTVAVLVTCNVNAELKAYIATSAEFNTECKTCPRSLCPNQLYYGQGDSFNTTCWTRGTKIMGDRLWLKSEAGCYITQYDVLEYDGDYTTDLEYCGSESEELNLTIEDATLKYKGECRICPNLTCDTMAWLKENTDLELTCWYPEGQIVIDDPYWLKTTNNCYVSRKHLYSKPDITYLDNCGPIPYLEPEKHNNENGTSDVNKRKTTSVLQPFGAMYLANVTVGEEYAYCRSCPDEKCGSEKRYEFEQEVWIQCVTENLANETWWSETIDFCYVKNSDFWKGPDDCKHAQHLDRIKLI
ncbi:hypothetical protein T440DRAFT_444950 [Plenodomus tracheiphilus IPT5]|uniref:Uncharacterized protein n=1 Tax=Plenodomus tracheiphilus IPT5 TaxID=1408161 RepID=A0A6A7BCK6_9PLEO|nr:hypothetical protein T440DRAFT_444950 [Plenodomus tracheiphilus IPT5]